MVRLLIPFALGVSLGAQGWAFPLGWALPSLNLLALLLLARRKMPYQWRWAFGLLLLPMLFMTGFRLSELNNELRRTSHFGKLTVPGAVLSGYVAEAPSNANWTRLVLEVETISPDGLAPPLRCSGRLMLLMEPTDSTRNIRPGDRLSIVSEVTPVSPPPNPDGFDFRKYLFYKNIHFQSFVKKGQWKPTGLPPNNHLQRWAYDLSCRFVSLFEKNIPSERECAVAVALVIGKKDDISADLRDSYAQTGAMHLLAVSGMHVGLLALMLHFLARRIPGKGKTMVLVRNLIPLVGAWAFALITGLSGSILRAAVMFTLTFIGAAWRRDTNLYNTLAGSAFLLLTFDPWLLFDAGFQLSYLAVLGIAIYQRPIAKCWTPRRRWARWAWELNAVSFAAQLSTLPLTLYYFHQFPLYFWLSALIGVPLSSLALPLGMAIFAFGNVPFLNATLGMALSASVWLMNAGILLVQKLPWAVIAVREMSFFEMSMLFGAIACITLAFAKRTALWVLIGMSCYLTMSISQEWRHLQLLRQLHVIAYHLKKASAIEFVEGNKSYVFFDSVAAAHPELLAPLADHRRSRGVARNFIVGDSLRANENDDMSAFWSDGTFVLFNNKRWGMLTCLPPMPAVPLKLDVLFIRGNPRIKMEDLLQRIDFQELVIDNTNSFSTAQKWKTACEILNKKVWVIKEQGAWYVDYLSE